MIQHVEHIGAKLEAKSLANREQPPQRQIHLRQAKTRDVVAALSTLPGRIRSDKGVGIERLSSRSTRVADPNRLTRYAIRAGSRITARREAIDHGVERKSAASDD